MFHVFHGFLHFNFPQATVVGIRQVWKFSFFIGPVLTPYIMVHTDSHGELGQILQYTVNLAFMKARYTK